MEARNSHGDGRRVHQAAWAALAVVLSLSALSGAAWAAQRVALVIGNSAYEHVQPLRNPGNDARAVGDAFERLGYSVTRLMDADYDALRQGLKSFKAAARGADVAVVFYAGHGIGVVGRGNFLVPVDAKLEYADDMDGEAMPLARATSAVGHTRQLGLVILDACRDNPFVKSMAGSTRSISRGLAPVETSGRTMVAYAAKDGTTALDIGGGAHSPYTEVLLKYLREEPGLEVRKLFGKVRDEVVEATERLGKRQEPYTYASLGGRDFYLASQSEDDEARRAYEAAVRAGAVAAYRKVVKGFPGSTYAKLAQAKIDEFDDEDPPPSDASRAYEQTERAGTVAAFRAFIEQFPGSFEASLAREQIAKLVKEEESHLGLSLEQRRLVQMGLLEAGHDPGSAGGMMDWGTREAIRGWQESNGLELTGYLTRAQMDTLVAVRRVAEAKRREREAREEILALRKLWSKLREKKDGADALSIEGEDEAGKALRSGDGRALSSAREKQAEAMILASEVEREAKELIKRSEAAEKRLKQRVAEREAHEAAFLAADMALGAERRQRP